jgi:large subunit ribosomal protein L10
MRAEKTQLVKDIGTTLENAEFVFLVSYKGLTVKAFSALRNRLAEHATECRVLKNRLILKAAEQRGMTALAGLSLSGDTALIAGRGDASVVAKAIAAFAREHSQVAAKAGVMEGQALTSADVLSIAELPPREVLQAQLLGVLQAPARNLVNVLYGKASQVVNLLHNYEQKLAGAA